MHHVRRRGLILAALFLSLASIGSPATLRADDPPPTDPTTSSSPTPFVATPAQWANATALILAVYPNADYATIVYYALLWFNMLPPVYGQLPSDLQSSPTLLA